MGDIWNLSLRVATLLISNLWMDRRKGKHQEFLRWLDLFISFAVFFLLSKCLLGCFDQKQFLACGRTAFAWCQEVCGGVTTTSCLRCYTGSATALTKKDLLIMISCGSSCPEKLGSLWSLSFPLHPPLFSSINADIEVQDVLWKCAFV